MKIKRLVDRWHCQKPVLRRTARGLVCTGYFGLVLTGAPLLQPFGMGVAVAQRQTAPAEVQQGYTLLGRGLVNDAIATFQRTIRRYPQSVEAKLGLAISYRRAGRIVEAWQAYQQVIAQDPNNQLALQTIGVLGGYKPEWQKRGIAALTTLLTLNPADAEALAQRALLYSYQGQLTESLADYQVLLQGNPTPAVLLNAAQVYTYTKNYSSALELFNRYRATTNQPLTGGAAIAYAQALRATGNPTQAIQILQAQLTQKLDATAIQVRSELSQAYLASGQAAEALAILDPLRGRDDAILPLARALNELGQKQNMPGLSAQAAALYRQALAQENPSVGLAREAADVLSGIPSEQPYALQLYRWLVQQQPNDKALVIQQLVLENQAGFLSQADLRQRLLTLLQPLPTEPPQQLAIAQALVRVDPAPELLPIYQTLIQAGVNEPFLLFRLAQILIQQNDFAGAINALAAYRATPAGARDQSPELLLADIDRRQGNFEASAQRYQAVLGRSTPDSDVSKAALQGLAGIRLTQGRPDEALVLYEQLLARNPQDLKIQLGWASVAYQAKRISTAQAEAVLYTWLQNRPPAEMPPELYSLVSALPPAPQREPLYAALIQADPDNIPVQVRLVQVLASRDPYQAQAQVNRLLVRARTAPNSRTSTGLYFLQGQLAQALGDSNQAAEAYKAILAFQPDNTDALAALGGIRFQQRQFESATQLYAQVLSLNPNDLAAQRSLAGLTAAQGNTLQAMQQLEQIQIQQNAVGLPSSDISQQIQKLQEDFLQQRGFQPSWERY